MAKIRVYVKEEVDAYSTDSIGSKCPTCQLPLYAVRISKKKMVGGIIPTSADYNYGKSCFIEGCEGVVRDSSINPELYYFTDISELVTLPKETNWELEIRKQRKLHEGISGQYQPGDRVPVHDIKRGWVVSLKKFELVKIVSLKKFESYVEVQYQKGDGKTQDSVLKKLTSVMLFNRQHEVDEQQVIHPDEDLSEFVQSKEILYYTRKEDAYHLQMGQVLDRGNRLELQLSNGDIVQIDENQIVYPGSTWFEEYVVGNTIQTVEDDDDVEHLIMNKNQTREENVVRVQETSGEGFEIPKSNDISQSEDKGNVFEEVGSQDPNIGDIVDAFALKRKWKVKHLESDQIIVILRTQHYDKSVEVRYKLENSKKMSHYFSEDDRFEIIKLPQD